LRPNAYERVHRYRTVWRAVGIALPGWAAALLFKNWLAHSAFDWRSSPLAVAVTAFFTMNESLKF